MPQLHDFATYQVYQTYHKQVHVSRETHTYDHFAASRASELRQNELLTAYMQEMINAILQDVNERGDCWLLRAIVSHELPAIHVLDHSAIAYVYTAAFCPEETPRLDSRSIPYTGGFTASPGGLLYSDRRAKAFTLDLRSSEELHPLCHALLMYAGQQAMKAQVSRLTEEKNALHSQITRLNDQLLGLQRELASVHRAAEAEPAGTDA